MHAAPAYDVTRIDSDIRDLRGDVQAMTRAIHEADLARVSEAAETRARLETLAAQMAACVAMLKAPAPGGTAPHEEVRARTGLWKALASAAAGLAGLAAAVGAWFVSHR